MREMTINLFTNVYQPDNKVRELELRACMGENERRGHFRNIISLPGRPTFNDFFRATQDHPDDINIIANLDIYFDGSLGLVRNFYERAGSRVCMALTRWDDVPKGKPVFYDHADSQDAWVFKGAVPEIPGADFGLGVPGCDNRIAFLLSAYGYDVINPSLTVVAHHVHWSGYRTYGEGRGKDKANVVPGPYLRVKPTKL